MSAKSPNNQNGPFVCLVCSILFKSNIDTKRTPAYFFFVVKVGFLGINFLFSFIPSIKIFLHKLFYLTNFTTFNLTCPVVSLALLLGQLFYGWTGATHFETRWVVWLIHTEVALSSASFKTS